MRFMGMITSIVAKPASEAIPRYLHKMSIESKIWNGPDQSMFKLESQLLVKISVWIGL